jgi:hypothetical protein
MRLLGALTIVVVVAAAAAAHDVPIDPSTCTFDPLEITVPELGLAATVAPATAEDAMRIVYTVATRTAQFEAVDTRARPFTIAGHAGTLAFPQAFQTELLSSGDLRFPLVGLTVTLNGDERFALLTLTTALLSADGLVAEGAPLAGGSLTLVGAIVPGLLPPPLDTVTTLVRATCTPTPAPDLDQFVPVFEPAKLRLVMNPRKGKLRAVLRGAAPEPDAYPMHLRILADGVPLVALDLPEGLTARKANRFTGETADGASIAVRIKPRGVPTHRVVVKLPGGAFPAGLADAGAIDVVYELGGLVARDGGTYRLHGEKLRASR